MATAKNIILNQFKNIQNKTINQDYENKIWQIAQENQINDIYNLVTYFENKIDDVIEDSFQCENSKYFVAQTIGPM